MIEVGNFYRDYLLVQHILLIGVGIWWIFKKNLKTRFFHAYLAFNFLCTSGALGHVRYNMNMTMQLPWLIRGFSLLLFLGVLLSIYAGLRFSRMSCFLPGLLAAAGLFFWERHFSGSDFAYYFWERFAFALFLFFILKMVFSENSWRLEKGPALLFLIPLLAGGFYQPAFALRDIFYSSYALFPAATLLAAVGFAGLSREKDLFTGSILLASSLFLLFSPFPEADKMFKMGNLTGSIFYIGLVFLRKEHIHDAGQRSA